MKFHLGFLALASIVLAGCGGGGSSSSSVARTAHVFATDDLNVGYDHVWVTVKKVVLHGSNGDITAYDDATGKVIDLRTLRDSTGARFLLLGTGAIPAGTYTGVDVTLAKELVIFPTGATTGVNATFAASGTTDKVITETFGTPAVVAENGTIAIDFDLAHWNLSGGIVSAPEGFVDRGETTGIEDEARHERDDFGGNVTALAGTAPTQTFTLGSVTVETTATTVIYDESGATAPFLANGARVDVRGAFDIATHRLVAESIKIENEGNTEHRPKVEGTVASFDGTAGSIVVDLRECEGFLPTRSTVTLTVSDTTTFFTGSGVSVDKATFFTALANGVEIRAQGTIDSTTGILTATKVKIGSGEGGHGGGGGGGGGHHDAELQGGVQTLDAETRTLVIQAKEWEGLNIAPNANVNVVVNVNADLGNFDNVGAFFAALSTGTKLELKGSYDVDTQILTASKVRIKND